MSAPSRHPGMHPLPYFRARLSAIGYALNGIRILIRQEPHARLHLLATVLVVIAGVVRRISMPGWTALITAIAMVWITEAVNTAVERLCDSWCRRAYHPQVKVIKDLCAGAVLMAAASSVVIALLVFIS